MPKKKLITNNLEQLKKVSSEIYQLISSQKINIITIRADLGAGKTSLVKSLLENYSCNKNEVTSPTFNLLNIYQLANKEEIWHFDLYRLKSADEFFELDFDQAIEKKLLIIEWPELIMKYLPKNKLDIEISSQDEIIRNYQISY
jgi:tRNA threonylcarbamoyladenosine biosynthesis protein TsaE